MSMLLSYLEASRQGSMPDIDLKSNRSGALLNDRRSINNYNQADLPRLSVHFAVTCRGWETIASPASM